MHILNISLGWFVDFWILGEIANSMIQPLPSKLNLGLFLSCRGYGQTIFSSLSENIPLNIDGLYIIKNRFLK